MKKAVFVIIGLILLGGCVASHHMSHVEFRDAHTIVSKRLGLKMTIDDRFVLKTHGVEDSKKTKDYAGFSSGGGKEIRWDDSSHTQLEGNKLSNFAVLTLNEQFLKSGYTWESAAPSGNNEYITIDGVRFYTFSEKFYFNGVKCFRKTLFNSFGSNRLWIKLTHTLDYDYDYGDFPVHFEKYTPEEVATPALTVEKEVPLMVQ